MWAVITSKESDQGPEVLSIINKHYESRLKISVLHDNKNNLTIDMYKICAFV